MIAPMPFKAAKKTTHQSFLHDSVPTFWVPSVKQSSRSVILLCPPFEEFEDGNHIIREENWMQGTYL